MQEMLRTQVQSLGREDPLEEELATHSSTLQFVGLQESDPTEHAYTSIEWNTTQP